MINSFDTLQGKILIVDDQQVNVTLLERILHNAGYVGISSTTQSLEVCELHREHDYDLILLDLKMPVMDGVEVMENLKTIETGGYLPVLVITGQPDQKQRVFNAGAKDFISKPFEIPEVLARVANMLEVRLLHKQLQHYNQALEQRVRERTADLQASYLETIFTMTRAAENKDEDTGAHVQRISYYSREIATLLGMDNDFVETIFFASPMHDIGKIGIPDDILLKPSSLTNNEWQIMQTHTTMGAEILGNSQSPYLKMGSEIALNHHECWNGSGYPNNKQGEAIPLAARIVNICDVYDALRSKRSYKPAFNHEKTLSIIAHGDGRTQAEHFDPAIFEIFKHNQHLFSDIFEAYA
ncbi:MAG: HD domain-containing phosphohydrolase [Methylococcales bacterium]